MKRNFLKNCAFAMMMGLIPLASLHARQLDPEEALQRVFVNNQAKRITGDNQLSLSYTESFNGENYTYIFSRPNNGFIVVSADDRMPALLGYSDKGSFDPDNIPPAMKWWLSMYAEETAASFSGPFLQTSASINSTRTDEERSKTLPLLSTQWGQKDPFNLDCPETDGQKCVTGCVATAMAQVIKYHAYPDYGNSTHTYQVQDSVFAATHDSLTFNFADTRFNYSDMLDRYTSSASEEQRRAVANLMYACGVSVNMKYSIKESGASDTYIPFALRNYFRYDNNVRLMLREFFSQPEWENLIYSEINEKRPVIMGGQTPGGGGHQFVCDGYDGDGYFHINWGWEGLADGNYLLTALNPPTQGTGGHAGGYNYNQTAVIGIQPPVEDSPVWYPIYTDGGIKALGITKNNVNIIFDENCGIFNLSPEPVTVTMLIQAVDEEGKEYIADLGKVLKFTGMNGLNYSGFGDLGSMNLPTNLPKGDYKCYIVFKTPEGNIQQVMIPYTSARYFNLTIDENGNVSGNTGDPDAKATIRVNKFEPLTPLIQGSSATFDISIENIGDIEYIGAIGLHIYKQEATKPFISSPITEITLDAGRKLNGHLNLEMTFGSGVFDIVFYDKYGDDISDSFQISVEDSSVDTMTTDALATDIYSATGLLLKRNASREDIDALPKGLYILKSGTKSVTVLK